MFKDSAILEINQIFTPDDGNFFHNRRDVRIYDSEAAPLNRYHFHIPVFSLVRAPWTSEGTPLTVPDLADTVEQMLERRAAGVASLPTALSIRKFPTDPSSIKTAGEFVRNLKESAELQLKATEAELAAARQAALVAKKKREAEQAEFADFKAKKLLGANNP